LNFYDKWPGRGSYTKQAIFGRTVGTPFVKNDLLKRCELQCDDDWWLDWKYWHSPKLFIKNNELQTFSEEVTPYQDSWGYERKLEVTYDKEGVSKNIA